MKTNGFVLPLSILSAALVFACSSARDVEVTGEVTAAVGTTPAKIHVEFFDMAGEGDTLEKNSIQAIELTAPGSFKETVPVEGEKLLVRAIADDDGDGKCTAGEAWAEQQLSVKADGTVEAAKLQLAVQDCPAS